MVSSYSWDAKLALSLAAFALSFYGELCLLAQIYSSNQVAKSMTILKQLPVTMKQYRTLLKSQFDEINKFVKPLLDLTSSIVTFKELPSTYVNQDVPEFSAAMAEIPTTAYWIINGIVLCMSHAKLAYHYAASSIEAWKLPYLAKYINGIHDHLKKQLNTCNQLVHEKRKAEAYKRKVEAYNSLVNIFEMIHTDNLTVLKALIYAKENLMSLYNGSSKKIVNLEVLRKKTVLLLLSSLDIDENELYIRRLIYHQTQSVHFPQGFKLDNLYEIVWIPIVDQSSMQGTESMQTGAAPRLVCILGNQLDNQLQNYIVDMRSSNEFSELKEIGDLARKLVETKKDIVYPLVYLLIKLALILPVATATVERAFSAMKFIKNLLRNRMGDQWLNNCLVTYIEKDVFDSVDNELIMQRFQNMKSRRGQL
ncbi:hypothetical protein ACSBR1_040265 [Camellia fascicularis]